MPCRLLSLGTAAIDLDPSTLVVLGLFPSFMEVLLVMHVVPSCLPHAPSTQPQGRWLGRTRDPAASSRRRWILK